MLQQRHSGGAAGGAPSGSRAAPGRAGPGWMQIAVAAVACIGIATTVAAVLWARGDRQQRLPGGTRRAQQQQQPQLEASPRRRAPPAAAPSPDQGVRARVHGGDPAAPQSSRTPSSAPPTLLAAPALGGAPSGRAAGQPPAYPVPSSRPAAAAPLSFSSPSDGGSTTSLPPSTNSSAPAPNGTGQPQRRAPPPVGGRRGRRRPPPPPPEAPRGQPSAPPTPTPTAEPLPASSPSAETVLSWVARPAPHCKTCGRGVVVIGVADGPYAPMMHTWLLHMAPHLPSAVGSKGSGVAVCAVDRRLLRWCVDTAAPCWAEPNCERTRDALVGAAGDWKYRITPARSRTVAPQWCKVFALHRAVSLGFTALVMDLDILMTGDPVRGAADHLARTAAKETAAAAERLWYQCGERRADDDRIMALGVSSWPNTGLLLAPPGGSGARLAEHAAAEGNWTTEVAAIPLGVRAPLRPHLVCSPGTIARQLTGRLKALQGGSELPRASGKTTYPAFTYLCRLLRGLPNCTDSQIQEVIARQRSHSGAWGRRRLRGMLRELRQLLSDAIAQASANLTVAHLEDLLTRFCRGNISSPVQVVPARWCMSIPRAMAHLGVSHGSWAAVRNLTDADVRWWAKNLCNDIAWGEQEVVREMVVNTPSSQHSCLPEEVWAMAFRPCELPHKLVQHCQSPINRYSQSCRCDLHTIRHPERPDGRGILTLHLTGSSGWKHNGVRFKGGTRRFDVAQQLQLVPRPPCIARFASPEEWWAGSPPRGVNMSALPCGNNTLAVLTESVGTDWSRLKGRDVGLHQRGWRER